MAQRSARGKRRIGRRGRPRDDNAVRTASGRKSRARRPQEDPRAVVLAARRRHFGLPEHLASHEKAGTVLGRLWLAGDITDPSREAGERYLVIHAEAMRALKAPVGLAVSGTGGTAGDHASEEYVAWAIAAVARYEVLKVALEAGGFYRLVHAVVVEDTPVPSTSLPELVAGLAVLAVKLGTGAGRAGTGSAVYCCGPERPMSRSARKILE
jgi:hypothetical protein